MSAAPARRAERLSIAAEAHSLRMGYVMAHPVAKGRRDERCVVPTHPRGVRYLPQDREAEERLCAYSFHIRRSEPGRKAVAICPKRTSTNPAVEVFKLPKGQKKAALETKRICHRRRKPTPKLAKLKHSITCSYAPSILAYYHLSRALEVGIEIPPAVVRTFDRKRHWQLAKLGMEIGASHVARSWETFEAHHRHRRWKFAKHRLLTDDGKQLVGALSVNPRGERRYGRLNGRGPPGHMARPFLRGPIVAFLRSPTPVSTRFPRALSSAQNIRAMRDVGDMFVLDYLLAQDDRFGNVHARQFDYSFEASSGLRRRRARRRRPPLPDAVRVKEMVLKDNDCGVARANRMRRLKVMRELSHLHPRTYHRLQWLARSWALPELQRFAREQLRFTERDVARVGRNLTDLAALLARRCRSGKLRFDVDVEAHLAGIKAPTRCE